MAEENAEDKFSCVGAHMVFWYLSQKLNTHIIYQVGLDIYCKFENFREGFIFAEFSENKILGKCRNHCCLLIYVNHALVANF